MPMALTPYGGWHKEHKDLAESWTRKTSAIYGKVAFVRDIQRRRVLFSRHGPEETRGLPEEHHRARC